MPLEIPNADRPSGRDRRRDALLLSERTLTALRRGEREEIEAVMDDHLAYLERICKDALGRPRLHSLPDLLTSGQT